MGFFTLRARLNSVGAKRFYANKYKNKMNPPYLRILIFEFTVYTMLIKKGTVALFYKEYTCETSYHNMIYFF